MAYILKLCWELTNHQDKLWVRVLRAKYKTGDQRLPWVIRGQKISTTWKSIVAVWNKFLEGAYWKVGDGRNVSFWFDTWTSLEKPLVSYARNADSVLHLRVSDFTDRWGNWNRNLLHKTLPKEVIDIILLIKPPNTNLGEDTVRWKFRNDGRFTVKSAYDSLDFIHNQSQHGCWRKIWRWPTFEKIKIFLWKLAMGKIQTNSVRYAYGSTMDQTCPFGCNEPETPIHAVRDCVKAKQVWDKIIHHSLISDFFSSSVQDWIVWNSKHEASRFNNKALAWRCLFAQVCWWVWKTRCEWVFASKSLDADAVLHLSLHGAMEEYLTRNQRSRIDGIFCNIKDRWTPPQAEWVRMDVDGSVNRQGEAACGGLIRDSSGACIIGFMKKLQIANCTMAEISGILEGLKVCWQAGFRNVVLTTDSTEAINLIYRDVSVDPVMQNIVDQTRSYLHRDWCVHLEHVFREAIACADWLATEAVKGQNLFLVFTVPPFRCRELIDIDRQGI